MSLIATVSGPRAGSPAGRGEIKSLTGLRGCAATLVMFYHFSLSVPRETLPLQSVLRGGYLFVDLFFVLSGFVLAYSQARLFVGPYRWRIHAGFLLARLGRIYPLYAFITLESAFSAFWRAERPDVPELLRVLSLNLTLVQAWGLAPSLEGDAWSISTEWAAYLLFPLLLLFALSPVRRRAAWFAAAAVGAIIVVALWPSAAILPGQSRLGPLDIYSSATPLPLIRCVAEFGLGLLTFRFSQEYAAYLSRWAGTLAAVATVLIVWLLSREAADVWVVGLFCILIAALSCQTGIVARALGTAIPYNLGLWSYSIYLIHDKLSHSLASLHDILARFLPMPSLLAVGLMSLLVTVIAVGTYYVVELPARQLIRKVARRVRTEAAPLPAVDIVEGKANALG